MPYEMATKRVDLEGGHYVVLYQELRHGTQRAINAIVRPFMKTSKGGPVAKLTVNEEGPTPTVEGTSSVEIELAQVDFTAVNDLTILNQVKEWSFGPVDQATLDGISEAIIARLVNEANALYGKVPLAQGGGGNSAKDSSKP